VFCFGNWFLVFGSKAAGSETRRKKEKRDGTKEEARKGKKRKGETNGGTTIGMSARSHFHQREKGKDQEGTIQEEHMGFWEQ